MQKVFVLIERSAFDSQIPGAELVEQNDLSYDLDTAQSTQHGGQRFH